MNRTLRVRGRWPGRLTLRKGWAMAQARPWNDHVADAALRLDRGGPAMIGEATAWLHAHQVPSVMSPPLHRPATELWSEAGFGMYRTLHLFERDLSFAIDPPPVPVRAGRPDDWREVMEIDNQAFDPTWRVGRLGLADALAATLRSGYLVATTEPDRVDGFAIVGVSGTGGYLQRIAVRPERQGERLGSSLLLASLAWARGEGAHTMILNTQPENGAAGRLYLRHHFEPLPDSLYIYRHQS